MLLRLEVRPAFSGRTTVAVDFGYANDVCRLSVLREDPQYGLRDHPAYDPDRGAVVFERTLATAEAAHLADLLGRARVSIGAVGPMGLDGVSYRLEVDSGFTSLRLCWWLELPDGWRELAPLVDALTRLAHAYDGGGASGARASPPPTG